MINYFNLLLPYYSVPYFGGDFSLLHFTLCKSTLLGDVTPENNSRGEKWGRSSRTKICKAGCHQVPGCSILWHPHRTHLKTYPVEEVQSTSSLAPTSSQPKVQPQFKPLSIGTWSLSSVQIHYQPQFSPSLCCSLKYQSHLFIKQAFLIFLVKILFYCLDHVQLILLI